MNEELLVAEIKKLNLAEDDIIIVKVNRDKYTAVGASIIAENIHNKFKNDVIFISNDTDISTISKSELTKLIDGK